MQEIFDCIDATTVKTHAAQGNGPILAVCPRRVLIRSHQWLNSNSEVCNDELYIVLGYCTRSQLLYMDSTLLYRHSTVLCTGSAITRYNHDMRMQGDVRVCMTAKRDPLTRRRMNTVRSDSIRTSRVTDPLSGPKLSTGHRSQARMPNGKNVTSFKTY